MYRRFGFEGDIHQTLDCIPLTVRRKLDLAALKISLEGWQRFSRAERLAICHLPVDSAEDLDVYREVLRSFAVAHDVPLSELRTDTPAWNSVRVPPLLREQLDALDLAVPDREWQRLDEETRYALVKLAEPKRHPAKLPQLLAELGLMKPKTEPMLTKNVCKPTSVPQA